MDIPDDASSLDFTPAQVLQAALKEIQGEETPPDKMIVLCLWDENDKYATRFYNSGMKVSEIIALLEVMKSRMMRMILPDEPE